MSQAIDTSKTSDTRITYVDTREGRVWAPCRAECPVHIDVPGYLAAVSEGRFTDALEIVLERNPLAAVCGRVCLHPCEEGCRRCDVDEALAIASIKRAASDFGTYPTPSPAPAREESVAVVGSGPAGLTAAYDLALEGYPVTIYESKSKLGGMLRYGIPEYRLPEYALDRDIDYILSAGVEAKTGMRIGQDVSIDDLLAEHDVVLVSPGLQGSRPLPIPGSDLPGVLAALPFLEACGKGEDIDLGSKVVVVGGGNVAMDVARSAVRQGAEDVTCVCLESREEMPATDEEIEDAAEEGIRVLCAWGPKAVLGDDCVAGLETISCTSVFDENGRFAPTYDEDTLEKLDADTVIFAVGQGADVADLGLPLTERGGIEVDRQTLRTPVDRVYAAGDVTTGPTKVIDAVAQGHRAAASIIDDLRGDTHLLADFDAEHEALGEVPDIMASELQRRPRVTMRHLASDTRTGTWDEAALGYTELEAAREARRCLACTTGAVLDRDKCAVCLTCVRLCPHGGPMIGPDGVPDFTTELCHACGACASECPARAIDLEAYSDRRISEILQERLANPRPGQVVAFVCGYSPDVAEALGPDAEIIALPCILRVSERAVMEAFELGAQRVVFSPCVADDCRYPNAVGLVAERIARIQALAQDVGLGDCVEVFGSQEDAEIAAESEQAS